MYTHTSTHRHTQCKCCSLTARWRAVFTPSTACLPAVCVCVAACLLSVPAVCVCAWACLMLHTFRRCSGCGCNDMPKRRQHHPRASVTATTTSTSTSTCHKYQYKRGGEGGQRERRKAVKLPHSGFRIRHCLLARRASWTRFARISSAVVCPPPLPSPLQLLPFISYIPLPSVRRTVVSNFVSAWFTARILVYLSFFA